MATHETAGMSAGKGVRIDAHQHFWKYDPAVHGWIGDDMWVIRKNFAATDLEPLLRDAGIDGCVTVQVNQTEDENTAMLADAEKHAFIKGIVGWVDLVDAAVEDRLGFYQ